GCRLRSQLAALVARPASTAIARRRREDLRTEHARLCEVTSLFLLLLPGRLGDAASPLAAAQTERQCHRQARSTEEDEERRAQDRVRDAELFGRQKSDQSAHSVIRSITNEASLSNLGIDYRGLDQ